MTLPLFKYNISSQHNQSSVYSISEKIFIITKLSSELILISDVVAPIQLPTQRPEDATFCTVTGWGTTAVNFNTIFFKVTFFPKFLLQISL